MTPVDVGPEFSLFWLLVFGLPAAILLGLLAYRMGWLGSGATAILARLWARIRGWFGRAPTLTAAITAEQQAQLAALESARRIGLLSDTQYASAKARILEEHP